jgi:3-methyladenine DNA glycosylase AlkC
MAGIDRAPTHAQMKAQSTFSLKDQLFSPAKVDYLATLIEAVHPGFPGAAFRNEAVSALPALELKERIAHIANLLYAHLPVRYTESVAIILEALPPELDPTRTDDDFGDFIFAPFAQFVAMQGCTAEYLDVSLRALREITKRFSAEDAMRPFLNVFPEETLAFLETCTADRHYHVRRLASESTRPLLPWAQRLRIDYRAPMPILDRLFADRTRYVTRSVSNHLNDISKIDPQLVLGTLRRWRETGQQTPSEMAFITTHTLRSLVREGNTGALDLIGFGEEPDITITEFTTSTPRVRVGDAFHFSLILRANNRRQKLLVDYVMEFAGERRRTGRKVFKLKQLDLAAGESVTLTKAHPMRLMTTRRLHAGEHRITLQVNGQPQGALAFELIPG